MKILLAVEPVDFRKGIDGLIYCIIKIEQYCKVKFPTIAIKAIIYVFPHAPESHLYWNLGQIIFKKNHLYIFPI